MLVNLGWERELENGRDEDTLHKCIKLSLSEFKLFFMGSSCQETDMLKRKKYKCNIIQVILFKV